MSLSSGIGSAVQIVFMNFEKMKSFANSFRGQEAATQQTIQKLSRVVEQLRGKDWIGEGATAFLNEMDSEVFPALKRLQSALADGDRVSKEMERLQHETENMLVSIFKEMLGKFGQALS